MVAFSSVVGLIASTLADATQISFLQKIATEPHSLGLLQHRAAGDWDETEVRLCRFGSIPGFDNLIKVFAEESDNTRYVSFARVGHASDDGFIESMQKCKGALPEICKHMNASGTPKGCAVCPCEMDLEQEPYGNYQRRMMELLTPHCKSPNKKPFRVLLVGLGGGALVQHVFGACPKGSLVHAIEYDPRMIEVATRFFGLHPPSPDVLQIDRGDGGAVVAKLADKGETFDMVLVDAFAGGSHVPESCKDKAFVGNLRRLLKNGGTVLHNMAGPTYNNQAGTDDHNIALPLYKDSFGSGSVDLETLTGNLEFPSYLVVAKVPSQ